MGMISIKQASTRKAYKFLMSFKSTVMNILINILILVVATALMISVAFACINVKVDKLSAVSEIETQTVAGLAASEEKTAYLVGVKKLLAQDQIRKWDMGMNEIRYDKAVKSDLAIKANTATLGIIEEVDRQLAATTTD